MSKKKEIGLFFGSFNPIHVGHLIIANTVQQNTDLDEVWFVISPQSPFKKKKSLLSESLRLDFVEEAIQDNQNLKASTIEFTLPQPSYTIDTLTYLQEKHGDQYLFSLIMGSDNLVGLVKWKNYNEILMHYKIYVYNRPGSEESDFHSHESVFIVDGPLLYISASMIRNYIKQDKSVKYLVTEPVYQLLEKYNYYK